jgi:hypothetical protein
LTRRPLTRRPAAARALPHPPPAAASCSTSPKALKCSNYECNKAGGPPAKLSERCTTNLPGANIQFTINGEQAQTYTCPAPESPISVEASITQGNCLYKSNFTITSERARLQSADGRQAAGRGSSQVPCRSPCQDCTARAPFRCYFLHPRLTRPPPQPRALGRCFSNAQAQVTCSETTCTSGTTVDSLASACTSPLSGSPGAAWSFDPEGPYKCPAADETESVKAVLTVRAPSGTGTCTYAAHAKLTGTSECGWCRPRRTPPSAAAAADARATLHTLRAPP